MNKFVLNEYGLIGCNLIEHDANKFTRVYIALKHFLSGAIYVFIQLYKICTYSVFSPNRALVVPSLREQENRDSSS